MPLPPPRLLRKTSKALNRFFRICWLVPIDVEHDERVIRAIYSPYHVDKQNRLKHQAYDPTPGTDEVSTMRVEHMGASLCRSKAKSFQNPRKLLVGLAALEVEAIVSQGMGVVDSRQHFCGHADIRFLMAELANLKRGEPPPPEVGKRLKDLKDNLVKCSTFFPDPRPDEPNRRSREFLAQVDSRG